jgi:hypothetical protein
MNQTLSKRMSLVAGGITRMTLVCIALALPDALHAQAVIKGRVVDSETGHPVAGATVTLRKGNKTYTVDSLGRFEARDLATGEIQLLVQKVGFAPADYRVRVNDAGEYEVKARAEQVMSRYSDFEARRQRGMGAFLRWDQLTDEKFSSVGDALRTIRGVRIQCHQETFECRAIMARSPQCQPVWVIDGMEAGSFNENTPIRDVYGIEVYRGAGEIPGEYGGSNAACGVIVIWTKSRPFRSMSP